MRIFQRGPYPRRVDARRLQEPARVDHGTIQTEHLPRVLLRRQVELAEHPRAVAGPVERFGQGDFRGREQPHARNADRARVTARQDRGAGRHAHRALGERVVEHRAPGGQAVEVRRLHDRMTHEPEHVGPVLVAHEEDHVGSAAGAHPAIGPSATIRRTPRSVIAFFIAASMPASVTMVPTSDKPGDEGQARLAELAGVGDHDQLRGESHDAAVHHGLGQPVVGQAVFRVDALDADDRLVRPQLGEALLHEEADEGPLGVAEKPAGDHEVDLGNVGEKVHDRERVRDDPQLAARGEVPRHLEHRGTAAEEDGLAVVDQRGRRPPDGALLLRVHAAALEHRGFLEQALADDRAAVHPLDQALGGEAREVAPNRRLARLEERAELLHPARPFCSTYLRILSRRSSFTSGDCNARPVRGQAIRGSRAATALAAVASRRHTGAREGGVEPTEVPR